MTATREDIILWLEPDTTIAAGGGTFKLDWSRNQRVVTATGTSMTFGSGVLPLNSDPTPANWNNYIDAASAATLSDYAATGFTVMAVLAVNGTLTGNHWLLDFGGTNQNDVFVASTGRVTARLDGTNADLSLTTPASGSIILPTSASATLYAVVLRYIPNSLDGGNGGTMKINLATVGISLADFQATMGVGTSTGFGTPAAGASTLRIGARDNGTSFAPISVDSVLLASRSLTDQEVVDLMATAPTFTSVPYNTTLGVIDHSDPDLLDATNFQAVVATARSRNVHIVIGPGESHGGTGNLTSSATPGIANILQQAVGRAVGLSGIGLSRFTNIPVGSSSTNSSVHILPASYMPGANNSWEAKTAASESTLGLFDTSVDNVFVSRAAGAASRNIAHIQRLVFDPAREWVGGFQYYEGMDNLWDLIRSRRIDQFNAYYNNPTGSATGVHSFTQCLSGADFTVVGNWSTTGTTMSNGVGTTLTRRTWSVSTSAIGVGIDNEGGSGVGMGLSAFDCRSPDPGARIGCIGVSSGGETLGELRQTVWAKLIELASIDYLGLCPPITNDSPGTPISSWWHDCQTVIRASVAGSGTGFNSGVRTFGIWIPVEADLSPADKQAAQRTRADLLASLAVELGIDLISFPAFVTPYVDGDAAVQDWYDGVHLGADGFGAVVALFEENVMPSLASSSGRRRSRTRG
jgi:hypothetical protein